KLRAFLLFSIPVLALVAFVPQWQQADFINRLVAKLTAFHNKYPQEKVYLHLDKPYYAAGEDIWFKAYLVNAHDHTPSLMSRVLYVELITPENTFYKTSVIRLLKGRGNGDFALPDDIPEGLYRLRAFTNWMQNFDEGFFFHQNIHIYNARKTDIATTTAFTYKRQGEGDSVLVNLKLSDYNEKPLAKTVISYSTNYARGASSKKITTGADGKAVLRLYLPDGASTSPKLHYTIEQASGNLNHTIPFPPAQDQLDLQFFPEGGNLVGGLWSTVGFKAVDGNGLGKDVQGAIYDQQGQKVADFKSQKFGMGRVSFIPDASKKYVARLTSPKGKAKDYPLPVPQKKGFILSVDNKSPEVLKVKFYSLGFQADSIGKPKALSMVAQVRGEVLYAASSPTARDVFQVEVPTNKFPSGIVQFTVFSEKGEPLAERVVFVNRGPQVQLTLTPGRPAYKPREKVTMLLEAKDEKGTPVAGTFSLAITDQKAVMPAPNANTIVSHLLLTSDLKGHIEDPGYYFSSAAPEVATALDNLMLTQGWRRFIWQDLLQDKLPKLSYASQKGLYLNGTVSRLTGQPDAYASITLQELTNFNFKLTAVADEKGRFQFPLDSFNDSSKIVVQATKSLIGSALELESGLPQIQVFPQVPFNTVAAPFSNEIWAYLRRNREQLKLDQFSGKSGILLQQVVVKGKKEEERPTTSRLYGTPDQVVKGSDLSQNMDIIQSLQGRVAGLQVSGGQVSMRGGGQPLYLLDGMPVDAQFIQSLSPNEVESVEILKPGASSAMYGSQGGNGVIAVNMKRGGAGGSGSSSSTGPPKLPGSATYQGLFYSKVREFYLPKYDKPDTTNVVMPDLRTTLFWSPKVETDATGKAEITFFAADQKTTYQAILQGMTPAGKLGYLRTSFVVK
ncbi:MAG: TonB-dependent receptor plug domain-containing protein, partial [Rufibacter sp.]